MYFSIDHLLVKKNDLALFLYSPTPPLDAVVRPLCYVQLPQNFPRHHFYGNGTVQATLGSDRSRMGTETWANFRTSYTRVASLESALLLGV